MQTWPVQDAKARFSEFLDTCLNEGPQMVTRRGIEAAVLRMKTRLKNWKHGWTSLHRATTCCRWTALSFAAGPG